MRRGILSAGAFLATLALVFALAGAPANAEPSVKIVAADHGQTTVGGEPKVCNFYLQLDGYAAGTSGTWTVSGLAPDAGFGSDHGTFGPIDASGSWHTRDIKVANGHYQVSVTNGGTTTLPFTSDCGTSGGWPSQDPTVGSMSASSMASASSASASLSLRSAGTTMDLGADAHACASTRS